MCYSKKDKTIIIFSSKGNSAKNVALQILKCAPSDTEILSLNTNFTLAENLHFDKFIFVCPTYGDEELEHTMEEFLINSNWNLHINKEFSVCELGLYRGYKETEQGAGIIIIKYLTSKKLILEKNLLSLDSMPMLSFDLVESWGNLIFKDENK